MTGLQDAFHAKVAKKFGLERGVRGSKAEHETIAEYYARVNAKAPPVPTRAGLILMSEDERLETMKTLHAQATEAQAKLDKLEDERKQHAQKIEGLEYMLEQNKEREKDMIEKNKERENLTRKAVARLIKNTYSPAEFAKAFGVELRGKADIFDTLVKAGEAMDFAEAVAKVAVKMPPKGQGAHSWEELAAFTVELDDPKHQAQPQAVARPKPRGFGR